MRQLICHAGKLCQRKCTKRRRLHVLAGIQRYRAGASLARIVLLNHTMTGLVSHGLTSVFPACRGPGRPLNKKRERLNVGIADCDTANVKADKKALSPEDLAMVMAC
jgi:hypothetical protein